MTIAAGIIHRRGVTIAADTKEGYGDTHTYVDKITPAFGKSGYGAIASSGESYLLDYITPFIQQLISDGNWKSSEEFESNLQSLMVRLYRSDAVKAYPKEKPSDLYTQFLVAAKGADADEASLFIVNSTLVTKARQLGTVIGCGPLRELGEEFGTVAAFNSARAKIAALTIVHEAKRRYSDVGGTISVTSVLTDNRVEGENPSQQSELEVLLDSVRQLTNKITVGVLDSSLGPARFSEMLASNNYQLRTIRRKAIAIDKRYKQDAINLLSELKAPLRKKPIIDRNIPA